MRLNIAKSNDNAKAIKDFADWILKIGDGHMNFNENDEGNIEIPKELLIDDNDSALQSLVNFVYPEFLLNMRNPNFFYDGAILCPITDSVELVNEFILSLIPSEEEIYLSFDTPCQSDEDQ